MAKLVFLAVLGIALIFLMQSLPASSEVNVLRRIRGASDDHSHDHDHEHDHEHDHFHEHIVPGDHNHTHENLTYPFNHTHAHNHTHSHDHDHLDGHDHDHDHDVDHTHDTDDHTHEHTHEDGTTHEHGHDATDEDHTHDHDTDDHSHDHDHGDHSHDHDHGHDHANERYDYGYFENVGNYLLGQEIADVRASGEFQDGVEKNLTQNQVSVLVSSLFQRVNCYDRVADCDQCIDVFVRDLFTATDVPPEDGFTEFIYHEAAPLLIYGLYRLPDVCAAGLSGNDLSESVVFPVLFSAGSDNLGETVSEADLDEILLTIRDNYSPSTRGTCFDAFAIYDETIPDPSAGASGGDLHTASQLVIANLLQGLCIGETVLPPADDFINDIFDTYGAHGYIYADGFDNMLSALGIGATSTHTHSHEHDGVVHEHEHDHSDDDHSHDHGDDHTHEHTHDDGTTHDHEHDTSDADHSHDHDADHTHEHTHEDGTTHEHSHDDSDDDHSHDHDDFHEHEHTHEDGTTHSHGHEETDEDHSHDHPTDSTHTHADGTTHDHRRRRSNKKEVSRKKRHVDSVSHDHSNQLDVSATCYTGDQLLDIFGVDIDSGISVGQFNLMAPSILQQVMSGVCYLAEPTLAQTNARAMWGYGTLAVLIICICGVLGALLVPCMSDSVYEAILHTMIGLGVATLSGDAILHLIPEAVELHAHNPFGPSHGSAGHSHSVTELDYVWKCLIVEVALYVLFFFQRMCSLMSCRSESHSQAHGEGAVEMDQINSAMAYRNAGADSKKNLADTEGGAAGSDDGCIKGCGRTSTLTILENTLHIFAEGLVIGAAFTVSIPAGISTSIAVLFRQLPHGLGDLAILLNQGMRLPTAVLLNILSACFMFVGFWIGIPLALADTGRQWMFAAGAGVFFYVALVNMLPLLHAYKGNNKGFIFFLQNIGFLAGIIIILVIAISEDINNIIF